MKSQIKFTEEHLKDRGERPAYGFHADVTFNTDATSAEQRVRLIVADAGADGWLCAVYYPDTKESMTLAQYSDIDNAKAKVEGWVRTVHKARHAIEWVPGLPSGAESSGAKS
jgi:hypothetical protein